MQRLVIVVAVAIALNASSTVPVQADPIRSQSLRITSGTVIWSGTGEGTGPSMEVILNGADFKLEFFGSPNLSLRLPIGADGLVNPSHAHSENVRFFSFQVGSRLIQNSEQPWAFRFKLNAPLTLPRRGEPNFVDLFFPFAFRGSLSGSAENETFDFDLVGRGRGSIGGFEFPELPGSMFVEHGELFFDNAAPVPEPATVLLLGAGTGIAVMRRMRRRADHHAD